MSRPLCREAISIYGGRVVAYEIPEIASTGMERDSVEGDSTPFSKGELLSLWVPAK